MNVHFPPGIWRQLRLILLSFLFPAALMAQKKITGTIINDRDKQPVAGATISVARTNITVTSDAAGTFSVDVPAGRRFLEITYVGFEKMTVDISSGTVFPVSLKEGQTSLDQVVVTGYTSQRKKDLTGAVSIVNVENMNKQPTNQITNQLQGQAPGVTVIGSGQPGEQPQIRIRGINTFGDNTPLFVVDGVPTQNISDLNPNDVSSIQVLKDAGAASIYGSRASNGVIIVTTKKGRIGKPTITYDGYLGNQNVRKGNVWHALNPQEMAQLKFNALANTGTPVGPGAADVLYGDGSTPVLPDYINPAGAKEGDPSVDPALYFVNPNYTNPNDPNSFYQITRANKTGTDWYHAILRNALITNHNLSVSGASDNAHYLFSLNYFNQQGVLINTYEKKYAMRANTSFNVSKNIRVGENLSYTAQQNPEISTLNGGTPIAFSYRIQPIIPIYDIKGNYGGNAGAPLGDAPNPVATQQRTANDRTLDYRLFGNVFADVDFLHHFTFHTSFGGENYNGNSHNFSYPTYENQENTLTNSYSEQSYSGYNWTWTNTLSYKNNFGKHSVSVLGGVESYDESSENLNGQAFGYFSFNPDFTTLGTASGTMTTSSSRSSYGLWSQFGRVDYAYDDKYLLSATIRNDESSKFKYGVNGVFPAVTGAWRLSQENFMKNITWLTDLKIRGGWGVMGNQINLTPANAYYTYTQSKDNSYYDLTGTNNSVQQGFTVGQIGNPDAKWESDQNSNVGVDATLFHGAIDISADYYVKKIKDLLYNPTLPGTFGRGTQPYQNVSTMKNTGVDLSVAYHQAVGRDLQINATLTFTSFKNKVTQVTQSTNYFLSGDGRDFGQQFIRNQVGGAVGAFYGYNIVGFWNSTDEIAAADAQAQQATGDPSATYQTDEGVGRFRYQDVDKNGQITADDRKIIGKPNPDFNYGLNLGASFKNFDFSVFLYGVHGNQIWNQVRWWTDFYASFGGGKSQTALYDSWTPGNHNAKAPIQEANGYASTNSSPNSYYVESGSYLRAKNMMLGYTIPKKVFGKTGIENIRVYIQAANLFTVTKYTGQDPEINGSGGVREFGIDEGSYPNTRQFLFGLSVKF